MFEQAAHVKQDIQWLSVPAPPSAEAQTWVSLLHSAVNFHKTHESTIMPEIQTIWSIADRFARKQTKSVGEVRERIAVKQVA